MNITILFVFDIFFSKELISKNYFEVEIFSFIYFYISLIMIFMMGLYDDKYGLKPNMKILIYFQLFLYYLC